VSDDEVCVGCRSYGFCDHFHGGCPSAARLYNRRYLRNARARVSVFLYPQDSPSTGRELDLRRYGAGQYMTPINWDVTRPMELAVRTTRRGMPDETSYFKLDPGMEPQTR
jgi:hypothetical protein